VDRSYSIYSGSSDIPDLRIPWGAFLMDILQASAALKFAKKMITNRANPSIDEAKKTLTKMGVDPDNPEQLKGFLLKEACSIASATGSPLDSHEIMAQITAEMSRGVTFGEALPVIVNKLPAPDEIKLLILSLVDD